MYSHLDELNFTIDYRSSLYKIHEKTFKIEKNNNENDSFLHHLVFPRFSAVIFADKKIKVSYYVDDKFSNKNRTQKVLVQKNFLTLKDIRFQDECDNDIKSIILGIAEAYLANMQFNKAKDFHSARHRYINCIHDEVDEYMQSKVTTLDPDFDEAFEAYIELGEFERDEEQALRDSVAKLKSDIASNKNNC
jgi:hypothetical protein